jgi:hypothetical protein
MSDDLTPLQRSILEALEGKTYGKDELARLLGLSPTLLASIGGLGVLRSRGLLAVGPGNRFYRPDAPPPGGPAAPGEPDTRP